MKVFVIMGNDYPEKVFKHKKDADAFVKANMKAQQGSIRIYWRAYEYDLIETNSSEA